MKKLLGYQLVSATGEYPDWHYSFEIYTLASLLERRLGMPSPNKWFLMPIYEGDIEEPTIM